MENFILNYNRLSIRAGLCGLISERNMVISNGVIFPVERTFCLLELRRIQHLLQCRNFIVKLGHGRQETERFQQRHTRMCLAIGKMCMYLARIRKLQSFCTSIHSDSRKKFMYWNTLTG